jgi:hypothetical protein
MRRGGRGISGDDFAGSGGDVDVAMEASMPKTTNLPVTLQPPQSKRFDFPITAGAPRRWFWK